MMMVQCSHRYLGALEINILKLMVNKTKKDKGMKKMLILKEMLKLKVKQILKLKQILKQKLSVKPTILHYHEFEEELMLIRSSKIFINQVVPLLDLILVWLTSVEVFLLFPC